SQGRESQVGCPDRDPGFQSIQLESKPRRADQRIPDDRAAMAVPDQMIGMPRLFELSETRQQRFPRCTAFPFRIVPGPMEWPIHECFARDCGGKRPLERAADLPPFFTAVGEVRSSRTMYENDGFRCASWT